MLKSYETRDAEEGVRRAWGCPAPPCTPRGDAPGCTQVLHPSIPILTNHQQIPADDQKARCSEQSTNPSVCPFHTSSPIPQRPTCSGPGGRRPPGQRRPRAARRTVGGRRRLEGYVPHGRGFWLRPGDVHFSQDHCHPRILHPAALQCSERTEGTTFQPTKLGTSAWRDIYFLICAATWVA